MDSLLRYIAPPTRCGYLPDQLWSLEYELVGEMSPDEYMERLLAGWRRFGVMLFRPRCTACTACRSLRVLVERFRPDRSQRRACRANAGEVELRIGEPSATRAKLDLYDRYHAFQADFKGWPEHPAKDVDSYIQSFVNNPFDTEEWCYYLDGKLIGVGYVDALPGGLSAIYFIYDPQQRHRSLGTWNVLRLIEETAARGLPHLYLGYHVAGCRSMEYKTHFVPNQILHEDGQWRDFRCA
jgi:arginine-tRNA-protein transferase